VIIGTDGVLVASNIPSEQKTENVGIIYNNAADAVKRMGYDRLHQLVCRTDQGFVVVYNLDDCVLATISNAHESKSLMRLMSSQITLTADGQQTLWQKFISWFNGLFRLKPQ
jgi:predicted regulator of Ras-like GTPase activity (Roadblock/LC7/MglB family)